MNKILVAVVTSVATTVVLGVLAVASGWLGDQFVTVTRDYIMQTVERNIYPRVEDRTQVVTSQGITQTVSCDVGDRPIGGFCVAQDEAMPLRQMNVGGNQVHCVYNEGNRAGEQVTVVATAICLPNNDDENRTVR